VGTAARLLARPEGLRLAEPSAARLTGRVSDRRFTGAVAYFSVDTASGATLEIAAPPSAAREGDTVGIEPTGSGLHLFPAAS
jgi:ABC-type Fe3+/spermidine/putrescine transport system ATPase subunit